MHNTPLEDQGSFYQTSSKVRSLPGEVVYKGVDVRTNSPVLIKSYLVSPTRSGNTQGDKFVKVMERLSAIKHHGLVPILNGEVGKGTFSVIFEDAPGEWLSDYLHRVALDSIPVFIRLDFLKSLAQPLAHLYEQGLVTGTIYPANILVSSRTGKALILDPGIARLSGISVSGFSSVITPYMPPEIILGRHLSYGSDVFSLAVIAFQILTSERPFKTETMQALYSTSKNGHRKSIIDFLPGATNDLDKVFDKALSNVPSDRFETPLSFIEALEEGLRISKLLESESEVITFRATKSEKRKSKKNQEEQVSSSTVIKRHNSSHLLKKIVISNSKKIPLQFLFILAILFLIILTIWLVLSRSNNDIDVENIPIAEVIVTNNFIDSTDGSGDDLIEIDQLDKVDGNISENDLIDLTEGSPDPAMIKEDTISELAITDINSLIQNPLTEEPLALMLLSEVVRRDELLSGNLIKTILKSPYYRVKINTLKAIADHTDGSKHSAKLLALASDEDPLVRAFAVKTIERVGQVTALRSDLIQWHKRESNPQVLEILDHVIASVGVVTEKRN